MEGNLDETPVPEVLQSFTANGRSGVLHLSREGTNKRVYFREGSIVFASSDDSEERLGERLVRAGALKRSELELACRVLASSNLRLGATLVEMGYLSSAELDRRVKEQITSIVHSLIPWESGVYRTELRERPIAPDLERADLSTTRILMEGVRRIEDFATIRRGLGQSDGPLSYALDPTKLSSDVELTPAEGFVLSRVDGATNAEEIAKLSPMGEEETLRCVYALIAAGILSVAGVKSGAPSPAGPEREVPPEALRFLEEMREKQRTLAQATLYEILEVEPEAPPEAIKAAYFRLAKRLHPDHLSGLKVADPDRVLDDLYLRVKEAYEVLSSETEKRRYDFARAQKAEKEARVKETAAAHPAPKGYSRPPTPDPVPAKSFTSSQTARIHFGNGERYFTDGRYHEAIEEFRTAVRLDPLRADYHRSLGKALAKNPKWRKQAEDEFSKALEINRFDAESYTGLGDLYLEGGLETRAKKMFEEALAIDPDNVHAQERLTPGQSEGSRFAKLKGMMKRSRS